MTFNQESTPTRRIPGLQSCLFLLVWLAFVLVTISGWLRMISAIRTWYWLSFAEVVPGPLYLAISGGLWGLAGLMAIVWFWLRRPWSRLVWLGTALFFALTFWADRLLFSRAPGSQSNLPFALLMTLLCLGVVLLALRPFEELRRFMNNDPSPTEIEKKHAVERSRQL